MHASLWSKAISMSSTRSVAVASPQLRAVQWLTPWRAAVPNATGRLVPPWSSRKSVRVLCVSPAVHAAPCASLPCAQLLYCVCRRALPHAASISTHRKTRSAYARRCPCSSRSLVCTSMTFLSPMLCRWVGGCGRRVCWWHSTAHHQTIRAVTTQNYHRFFKLYADPPAMSM